MMNSDTQLSGEVTAYSFDEQYAQYINVAESITDESNLITLNENVSIANSISAPTGWNRILDNGAVVYISPNKSRLRSLDDVRQYIMSASTCKCGLECPLHIEKVFSFNTAVATTQVVNKLSNMHPTGHYCKIDNGFQKLLLQFTSEKLAKLIRKGSKKKRKRPKNVDKEGKRRLHHIRKGQKPSSVVTEPWMNSIINKSVPAVSASAIKATNEDSMGSLAHFSTNSRSKHRVDPYSQTQNIDLVDHLTSGNTNSSVNGDLLATQRVLLHTSTETSLASSPGSSTVRTTPMKTTTKKGLPKSKRIPKTKEDLTIASMMGRVKQQVGDLDRVRTSQMFTQPYQSVPKQESRISSISEKKANAHTQSTYAPTEVNQSAEYNKAPAVMSLIEAKGPPNVTLPLSHSNMLPKAVAKGLEFPVTTSLQNASHAQNSSTAQFESQPHPMRQDSHLFSPKVSTNVYWGRDEQVAAKEGPQPPGLKQNAISSNRDGILSETAISEKLRGFEVAKGAHSNSSPLVVTANSSKSEYSGQYLGHHFMKETNTARVAGNETSMPAQVINIGNKPKDTSHFAFKNANMSKQHLSNESASKSSLYPDKSMSNDFLGAGRSLQQIGVSRIDEVVVGEPDVKVRATNTLSTVATTLKSNPQPVATSSAPAIKSPKGVSGNIKESLPTKPFQTQNATSVSQPHQPDVSFQNLYGISNPSNMIKGAVSACKGNSAGANQARFLIMGSQASQALQHLALQQSNTLQVSLQRTENSPAMYLQTLASYNPTTLNPSHGNIGFAYANVPIQLMALGGPHVVGKQQQAQAFNVDRYSNFYRYYSGSRQFEGPTNDHGNAVQATSLMFPGVNSANQATGSYIRIAPASHATSKIPLPMPIATTQSQPGQSASEEAQQQQALSSSGTQAGPNLASGTIVSNTNASNSTNSKEAGHISSAELARKPTIAQETLHDKGKRDDSVPPQSVATANCSASPQSENILRMKIMQEAKSHNMATPQAKGSSLLHIPQQSNGAGTLTASVETRDVPKTSNITVKNEPGLINELKVPIALHSPAERIDTPVSHHSRGLSTTPTEKSIESEHEELTLRCNEPCNNTSDTSRTPTPEMNTKNTVKIAYQLEPTVDISSSKVELKIGDLIWGHQKGYSAWPGKIVSAFEVKENSTENGKVWIQWFGEHTHSQMEVHSLKSLEEGLIEYRNSKRRKNRSNKKTIESLEAAIAEALNIANSRSITPVSSDNSSEFESEAKKPRN